MPNLDKTGPMGKGPMTGRKMGRCSENLPDEQFTPRGNRHRRGMGFGRCSSRRTGMQRRFRGGE
ncbi:MAG: DUF5320 domain-containing protein [Bacteroidales bacterium]|jgi:hypothetical protein|nr:DUF5320 domain-containing protein [Bacteroidales bacterium]MCO6467224.1 DUF5320 domain-containing protein [Bacteroidales bacterium]MCZ2283345.1 DUF5320 domain-containing protein [Bacteroidales bacterium]NLH32403.1 DUF5320 domain-containing protein [Lentimicrobium sp.]OQC36463.1 MAG: hypothetical protein BWX63_01887 [Bacteroidetes bacterium ADurb.Bin041]